MGKNKSAYESYRTGLWSLIGWCAVTAVNYLLAVFGMTLYFPFSAYIPRELIVRWGSGSGAAMIFVASAAQLQSRPRCATISQQIFQHEDEAFVSRNLRSFGMRQVNAYRHAPPGVS